MWMSLPLAALALAQPPSSAAGGLTLSNVRTLYGELGGIRPDTPLLPGDVLFVGFDIDGIAVDPDGKVSYTMGMEVQDKAGKAMLTQEPAQKDDFIPFGGTKLPARAYVTVGLNQPPGEYTLKVTVADRATKASRTLDRRFTVRPRDFGIVTVYTSADDRGAIPAPTTGVVGQSVFVQFRVVGFARGGDKKQPDVRVEMQPADDQGRPTVRKPQELTIDGGLKDDDAGFNVRFLLALTRPGKFTVRLKATDKLSGKVAGFDLPVAVVPAAN